MAKQETDTRSREVTNKDLETIDAAIASHETLYRNLWTMRTVLQEVGKLETQHHAARQGIEMVENEATRILSELEAAKARLAEVQQQESKTRQRLAELAREIEQKEQLLRNYSEAIERIVGKAA
jgi:hypothetical protein